MAVLNVDLGSSPQTINDANADNGDTINLTALGSQTLTIDGVNVTIDSVAGVAAGATPTFNLINGATLDTGGGLLNVALLGATTYNVSDTSTLALQTATAGVGVLSTTTVNFTGLQGGSLIIDNNAAVGLGGLTPVPINVTGLSYDDQIGFNTGAATFGSFVTTGANSGVLTLSAPAALGSSTFQFNITDTDPRVIADIQANGPAFFSNGILQPVCFVRGTMIATPKGEVPVETLAEGDVVIALGGNRVVRWIGYRFIAPARVAAEHRDTLLPIRIAAGALGDAQPTRDLLVSPGHHLLIGGKLVQAGALVNGGSIRQEVSDRRIDYFHVELEQFDALVSNGVLSESWADGGNRDYFQNVDVAALNPAQRARRFADRPGFTIMGAAEADALRLTLAARAVAPLRDAGFARSA